MTISEKKQILLSFAETDGYINDLQKELDFWRNKAYDISVTLSAEPKGTNSAGGSFSKTVERIIDIERQISDETDKLCRRRLKIVSAVKALPDIRHRRIIYLAYIGRNTGRGYERLKLAKIAREMNYSEKHIRRLHSAALEKLNLE